jgi:hypothetical protein
MLPPSGRVGAALSRWSARLFSGPQPGRCQYFTRFAQIDINKPLNR